MISVTEAIDRSLYEVVRLELVSQGFTPDFTSFPETLEGYKVYEGALQAIKDTRGFAIELFNISPPEDKGLIKAPRIVMMNESFIGGSIGGAVSPVLVPTSQGFDAVFNDSSSYDIIYSFILRATKTQELRALRGILHNALPSRTYIPFIGTNDMFFCELTGGNSRSGFKDGGLEDHYRYMVSDIFFSSHTQENVYKAITSISINFEIAERLNIITINNL